MLVNYSGDVEFGAEAEIGGVGEDVDAGLEAVGEGGEEGGEAEGLVSLEGHDGVDALDSYGRPRWPAVHHMSVNLAGVKTGALLWLFWDRLLII